MVDFHTLPPPALTSIGHVPLLLRLLLALHGPVGRWESPLRAACRTRLDPHVRPFLVAALARILDGLGSGSGSGAAQC